MGEVSLTNTVEVFLLRETRLNMFKKKKKEMLLSGWRRIYLPGCFVTVRDT